MQVGFLMIQICVSNWKGVSKKSKQSMLTFQICAVLMTYPLRIDTVLVGERKGRTDQQTI